jgi:hypothetical protein
MLAYVPSITRGCDDSEKQSAANKHHRMWREAEEVLILRSRRGLGRAELQQQFRSRLTTPSGVIGKAVGFLVVMSRNVCDGELERASQLAAGPIQRVQPRAAAGVLPSHLLDNKF